MIREWFRFLPKVTVPIFLRPFPIFKRDLHEGEDRRDIPPPWNRQNQGANEGREDRPAVAEG